MEKDCWRLNKLKWALFFFLFLFVEAPQQTTICWSLFKSDRMQLVLTRASLHIALYVWGIITIFCFMRFIHAWPEWDPYHTQQLVSTSPFPTFANCYPHVESHVICFLPFSITLYGMIQLSCIKNLLEAAELVGATKFESIQGRIRSICQKCED